METYLLFIYSNFKDNETKIRLITDYLAPIVVSTKLKFNYGDNSMVLNFKTDLEFNELREYVSEVISQIVSQYYLLNYSDKMSVSMPKDLYTHLFDLENESTDVDLDTRQIIPEKKGVGPNFTIFEQEISLPLPISGTTFGLTIFNPNEIIQEKSNYTIDDILDKINKTGYGSLTDDEKNFLKHSKQ
jgi:hypothetical protein